MCSKPPINTLIRKGIGKIGQVGGNAEMLPPDAFAPLVAATYDVF